MIHGIANGHLQSLCKLQKPLKVRFMTGDIILRGSVGPHDTPLIVVAKIAAVRIFSAQPYLCDVVKAAVLINLLRRDMAVVVYQRHRI